MLPTGDRQAAARLALSQQAAAPVNKATGGCSPSLIWQRLKSGRAGRKRRGVGAANGSGSDGVHAGEEASAGAVGLGALDVTFSASFYTGVFLSSRELQGNYKEHQEIVIKGLEGKLSWGWEYPLYGDDYWQKTVSPVYFVGVELDDPLEVLEQDVGCNISDFQDVYELASAKAEINFFEFGFGSVSIRFKGLERKQCMVDSAKDLKKILSACEESVKPILDDFVEKVAQAYRSSVPCCIKSSDIWDINNFDGLEMLQKPDGSEGLYSVGDIEVINILAVLEGIDQNNFNLLDIEMRKQFLCFSEELNDVPFNAECTLFKSDRNIIIALGQNVSSKINSTEIDNIVEAVKMMTVSTGIAKYFNNFFYSYFNYVSSEYEVITSRDFTRRSVIYRLKNLIEKFSDVKIIYSQVYLQLQEYAVNCGDYGKTKLVQLLWKNSRAQEVWDKSDASLAKLADINNRVDKIKSSNIGFANLSFINTTLMLIILGGILSALGVFLNIISNDDLERGESRFLSILIITASVVYLLALVSLGSYIYGKIYIAKRKLYYICGLQKHDYKDTFKSQEKRNKDKRSCMCEACLCGVDTCHRCYGSKWHKRVFYRTENRCFRCENMHKECDKLE